MICIFGIRELLKRMDSETAVEYLKKHGWRRIERKRKDIVVLQKETDGKFHQVIIPLDRELGDYCEALESALEEAAFVEGETPENLVFELLRNSSMCS